MRKLKIVFVSSGRNQFIRPYLSYFQQKGHQVFLISYDSFDSGRPSDYPVYDVSFGADARKRSTKWRYLLAALKTRSILKEIHPDILHGHYVTSSGVICLLSGFRAYIVSARGSDLIGAMDSFVWRTILKRVFLKSSLVHTVSEQLSAKVKELGVTEDKLFTMTQGVDTGVFDFKPPVKKLQKPFKMICTRTLGDVYDPETIVRACKLLNESGIPFELIFAAGGEMQDAVKAMVNQAGIANKIYFMGGYANRDLPDILKKHDIYLSASKWDGTSISLLEAMAIGLFPVVSRIDSNFAWLKDGRTAMMFDCGNEHQLADAICRAIENERLRISAIQLNRQVIVEKADRDTNMSILEKRYYEILDL